MGMRIYNIAAPTYTNNDVWNNVDNYNGVAEQGGSNGNITVDPLFTDASGNDFTLQSTSPCIDAGNSDPIYNDPDGSRNDMGAYGGPKAKTNQRLE